MKHAQKAQKLQNILKRTKYVFFREESHGFVLASGACSTAPAACSSFCGRENHSGHHFAEPINYFFKSSKQVKSLMQIKIQGSCSLHINQIQLLA